jgi:hypothetical protein
MSTFKVRDAAGTEFEVDQDKLHLAEKDGFLPVVSNGKDEHRVSSADLGAAEKDGFVPVSDDSTASRVMAGVKGVARGAFPIADELTGLAGAIVNPTNSDKGFVDRYRDSRDYARRQDHKDDVQHPTISGVSQFGGALAGGAVTAGVGNTLAGSAAFGAGQGLGTSEADLTKPSLENIGRAALDTAGGAVAGAAGYGAGKGIEKGVQAGRGAVTNGMEYLKALGRGAKRGAKEAGEDLPSIVKPLAEIGGGLKGVTDALRDLGVDAKEIKGVAEQARDLLKGQVKSGMQVKPLQQLQAIGNGKTLAEFTDDEALVGALMTDGHNPIKDWVKGKASSLVGQVDADEYGKVLSTSTAARGAARDFNPRDAAKALKPAVEETQQLFKGARDARFGTLQREAMEAFDEGGAASVLPALNHALVDANAQKSIPGAVRAALEDVDGIIMGGNGTSLQKLTPGAWAEAPAAEKFTRLQQARQLLDQQMNWAKREGLSQAESVLRGLRGTIDDALKTSPEKVEADALYRLSKDLEGRFFGAAEFRGPSGGIEIDEGKIARLLGNTDQANRFKAALGDLKEFAKRDDLAPAFRERAAALAEQIEGHISTADLKRGLGELRYKNGPTSPAVERLGSVTRGNSRLQDAVEAPAGFVNNVDQFNKLLASRLGKGFDQLDPAEKSAAVKFFVWQGKNPTAGKATEDAVWAKLFGQP